ncbi:MAG TPA: hypothetical protein VHT51_08545 [Micropepsaceae bacterium]|jgi:hypothetical protein|nr:hypothetical protein [Micropepsaceae bacterium]
MHDFMKTASRRIIVLAALLCAGATVAKSAAPNAVPNFSSDETVGWLSAGTEFISLPTGPHPVTPDPAHPYVLNGRRGQQPTLRVADLDNPILQPWVKDALKKVNDRVLSGKAAFPPQVRCWPLGVPGFLLYPAQPVFIIQTPKEVLLIWQSDQMVRHVFLTDHHSAHPKPSWFGESIGHYENGDTLVVDTIGLNTKTFVDNYRTPHTDGLHVVERFKLANAETRIEVSVTVEDPGAFTMPWTAQQIYRRVEVGPMGESTCAEGNFDYFNQDLDPLPEDDHPAF